MPWYLPGAALLGITALGDLISNIGDFRKRLAARKDKIAPFLYGGTLGLLALVLVGQSVLTVAWPTCSESTRPSWRMATGNRSACGFTNTPLVPRIRYFSSALGMLGIFRNSKMYDYPGLSSPEVVAARRKVGDDWARIVRLLKPSWLVLRPFEIQWIQSLDPTLLKTDYFVAKVFDVRQALSLTQNCLKRLPWASTRRLSSFTAEGRVSLTSCPLSSRESGLLSKN